MESFVPKIPKPAIIVQAPTLSQSFEDIIKTKKQSNEAHIDRTQDETLMSWITSSTKTAIKAAPKMAKVIGIQLGIVLIINLVFWQIETWRLPNLISGFVMLVVFLTATYNNVIPKTIYWVIVFTFGKRLVNRIVKEGFITAMSPIKNIIPEFKKSMVALSQNAYSYILIGSGIGLIIANNFASYSRFSGARNKIDKYFVAIVISFAVSYILGEGKKSGIIKFVTLFIQDISRLLKKAKPTLLNDTVFVLLSAFVFGLLLDAPLILMNLMYGGYILGGLALVGGVVLNFAPISTKSK